MNSRTLWQTAVAGSVVAFGGRNPITGLHRESERGRRSCTRCGVRSGNDPEATGSCKSPKSEKDAQVTLGGAQTFIEGDISRIEGTYYFVKKEDAGDETRLM